MKVRNVGIDKSLVRAVPINSVIAAERRRVAMNPAAVKDDVRRIHAHVNENLSGRHVDLRSAERIRLVSELNSYKSDVRREKQIGLFPIF